MSTFLVVYETVTNPEQFAKYTDALMPVIARRGGRVVAFGKATAVEGDFPWQQAAVIEWPSRQVAEEFWNSDEYGKIKKLRHGAAELQAVIIDGIV